MSHAYDPCGMCDRFPPAASAKEAATARTGYCSGWEKEVLSTGRPCVLFNERGTWAARQRQQRISRDQFPRDRKVARV